MKFTTKKFTNALLISFLCFTPCYADQDKNQTPTKEAKKAPRTVKLPKETRIQLVKQMEKAWAKAGDTLKPAQVDPILEFIASTINDHKNPDLSKVKIVRFKETKRTLVRSNGYSRTFPDPVAKK